MNDALERELLILVRHTNKLLLKFIKTIEPDFSSEDAIVRDVNEQVTDAQQNLPPQNKNNPNQ